MIALIADGNLTSWRWNEPQPRRRTLKDMEEAVTLLREADQLRESGEERAAKTLEEKAGKHGFHSYSPLMETGLHMVAGLGYDGMHSIANVSKAWRDALMGHGLLKAGTCRQHLMYEEKINQRFTGAASKMETLADIKDIINEGALPYPLNSDEKKVVQSRALQALNCGLLHPAFKGSRVFEAFDNESGSGSLLSLKCSDAHILMGPVGLYLIGGLCKRGFKVGDFVGTHAEVYALFIRAMNKLRKKAFTSSEAASIQEEIAEALSLLYLVFPAYEFDHSFHQVWEIARQVPIHVAANWGGERNLRTIRDKHKNNARPGATISKSLQRYIGVWFRDVTCPSDKVDAGTLMDEDESLPGISAAELLDFNRELESDIQVLPRTTDFDICMTGRIVEGSRLDLHVQASLWMYYLQSTEWTGASELHQLLDMFIEDGGDNPITAIGCQSKMHAMESMRRWFHGEAGNGGTQEVWWARRQQRELTSASGDVLYMDIHCTESSRVKCGSYKLRGKELDSGYKSSGSYFLARVEDDGDEHYEIGRAVRFIRHTPPGASSAGGEDVYFVVAKWLIPTVPRTTATTGLPMVVVDNAADVYLYDDDFSDKMVTDVWPVHGILHSPVCLAPLDQYHDIPTNTFVRQGPAARRRQANMTLRKLSRPNSKISVRDQQNAEPGAVIGAVLCMYCDINARL